ncbi:TPA: hypothetical protein ACF0PM_002247 [Clostridium perfringens]
MIECDMCEGYYHPDSIHVCEECGGEYCDSCYPKHLMRCRDGIIICNEEDEEDE